MPVEHTLHHRVTLEQHGQTIRTILTRDLHMARQVLVRIRRSGEVLCNGLPVYLKHHAAAGDVLAVTIREELEQHIEPEDILLDIVFEDEYLVVVNKPAGLVVHPTKGYLSGTLANALVSHWQKQGHAYVFRPVHRLDRDTSGLVVIAKNPHVQECLTAQHHTREWEKKYTAVVSGRIWAERGEIDAPIARVGNGSRARVVSSEGQVALTLWKKLRELQGATLVEAQLITGRTHQIRVHFAHIGHPLMGDDVYGAPTTLIQRQALHAGAISFTHPVTRGHMSVVAPLPADMLTLIDTLSEDSPR